MKPTNSETKIEYKETHHSEKPFETLVVQEEMLRRED